MVDPQVNCCAIRSDVGSAPVGRGEEGAEPKGKALDLPVDLHSYPHLVINFGW